MTTSGVFDVRSFYKLLSGPNIDEFPWECIWCAKMPKRVSFLWTSGQQLLMGYSPLIILLREVSPLLIGVACVGVMGKLWTISYFIVSWLMLFGVKFSSVWSPLGNAKDGYISSFC